MFSICLPIFIVILFGNILYRLKLADDAFIAGSNKLVMNVFLPVLIFNEVARSNFQEIFSYLHIVILLGTIIAGFLLCFPVARMLRLDVASFRTFVSSSFRPNAAFVGLPVCFYAFGNQGLTIASIYLAFIAPIDNILTVLAYNSAGANRINIAKTIKSAFFHPVVIVSLIGIGFSLLKIPLPAFLEKTCAILGGVALPLALLAIGTSISMRQMQGNFQVIFISSLVKLLIIPSVAYGLFVVTGFYDFGLLEKVMIILLASPTAQINYIFASVMNGNPELASGSIVFSTLMSALVFVFWLSVLM